jgi:MEMO1 family protein
MLKNKKTEMINRQAIVAGRFYKQDKAGLQEDIKQLFDQAPVSSEKGIRAVIAPHAGYVFSGMVAAAAYKKIDPDKTYENIFILATSHQLRYPGASIYCAGNYETPLGEVSVNHSLANKLIDEHTCFQFYPEAHKAEHSIEVQLPFLQYHMKPAFQIIPILLGSSSEKDCKEIAKALKPYFTKDNLFIVSTDFSHYPAYDIAIEVDTKMADIITKNNPEEFLKTIEDIRKENIPGLSTPICGWPGILTLLYLTEDEKTTQYNKILYKNSGDVNFGDKKGVVGYWAMSVENCK